MGGIQGTPLYGKRRSSHQEATRGVALFAQWIILYRKCCANFGGVREAQRQGGRLHTALLTADEMDSFWRCHQDIREFLLQAHSRARELFLHFAHLVTNNH